MLRRNVNSCSTRCVWAACVGCAWATHPFALLYADSDTNAHLPRRVVASLGNGAACVAALQEMIEEADKDNDGMISPEEFFRVMKKRSDNPLDDLDSDED